MSAGWSQLAIGVRAEDGITRTGGSRATSAFTFPEFLIIKTKPRYRETPHVAVFVARIDTLPRRSLEIASIWPRFVGDLESGKCCSYTDFIASWPVRINPTGGNNRYRGQAGRTLHTRTAKSKAKCPRSNIRIANKFTWIATRVGCEPTP